MLATTQPVTQYHIPEDMKLQKYQCGNLNSCKGANIYISITNKMQHYTIFFITINALRVSGGFSAHHQELKNCTHSNGYMSSLLAATASVGEFDIYTMLCTELLMMGRGTA
jgi:hypothetical protein